MKKILFISRELTHMYFHLEYIQHLINNDSEVHIACSVNKNTKDFIDKGIKIYNIEFERKAVSLKHKKAYNQIKELCQRNNYDLVHMHTPIAAFIGRFALRKLDISTVYTAHGLHFFRGSSIINWMFYYPLERLAANWTDALILINKEDFNFVKSSFKLRNSGNIYFLNGVGINISDFDGITSEDKYKYKRDLNISDGSLVISCVAELNKNKNQIMLLEAINKCENKENIDVMIIGEGNQEKELKKFCQNNELNNVNFLGYRRDVKYLLAISDILALVSNREGLPKSLMEGMASSLALLGTDVRGIRDLIKDGVNGYIVKNNDSETLSKYIDLLYDNRELLKRMKRKSKIMSREYDSNSIISELDKIYSDVYKRRENGKNSTFIG